MGQSYGIGLYYLVLNSIRFGINWFNCIWLCRVASVEHPDAHRHTRVGGRVGVSVRAVVPPAVAAAPMSIVDSIQLYIVSCCGC